MTNTASHTQTLTQPEPCGLAATHHALLGLAEQARADARTRGGSEAFVLRRMALLLELLALLAFNLIGRAGRAVAGAEPAFASIQPDGGPMRPGTGHTGHYDRLAPGAGRRARSRCDLRETFMIIGPDADAPPAMVPTGRLTEWRRGSAYPIVRRPEGRCLKPRNGGWSFPPNCGYFVTIQY